MTRTMREILLGRDTKRKKDIEEFKTRLGDIKPGEFVLYSVGPPRPTEYTITISGLHEIEGRFMHLKAGDVVSITPAEDSDES